jgi:hypothetical protein
MTTPWRQSRSSGRTSRPVDAVIRRPAPSRDRGWDVGEARGLRALVPTAGSSVTETRFISFREA